MKINKRTYRKRIGGMHKPHPLLRRPGAPLLRRPGAPQQNVRRRPGAPQQVKESKQYNLSQRIHDQMADSGRKAKFKVAVKLARIQQAIALTAVAAGGASFFETMAPVVAPIFATTGTGMLMLAGAGTFGGLFPIIMALYSGKLARAHQKQLERWEADVHKRDVMVSAPIPDATDVLLTPDDQLIIVEKVLTALGVGPEFAKEERNLEKYEKKPNLGDLMLTDNDINALKEVEETVFLALETVQEDGAVDISEKDTSVKTSEKQIETIKTMAEKLHHGNYSRQAVTEFKQSLLDTELNVKEIKEEQAKLDEDTTEIIEILEGALKNLTRLETRVEVLEEAFKK